MWAQADMLGVCSHYPRLDISYVSRCSCRWSCDDDISSSDASEAMAHPRDDGRRPSSSRSTADVVSCASPSLSGSEVFEFLVTRRTRSRCDPAVSITVDAPPARCYRHLRVWSRAGVCAFKLPVSAAHSQRWATSHAAWLLLTHSSPARRHNIPRRDDSGRHGHAVGLAPSTVGGNCT